MDIAVLYFLKFLEFVVYIGEGCVRMSLPLIREDFEGAPIPFPFHWFQWYEVIVVA